MMRRVDAGVTDDLMMARMACLILCLCGTGCATATSWQRDFHDYCRAKSSLHQLQGSAAVPNMGPFERHFQNGFKAGYSDVARGGEGCEPILPPHVYASHKYRGPAGAEAAQAWYQGFRYGAQAALSEGVRELNYLPVSPRYMEFLVAQQHGIPAVHPVSPADYDQTLLPPTESATLQAPVTDGPRFDLPSPKTGSPDSAPTPESDMRRLPAVDPTGAP